MSATNIVVFEKDGAVGARLAGALADLPARLRETRRRDAFQRALGGAPFPIAVVAVDADLSPLEVQELLIDAGRSRAASLVVFDAAFTVDPMECRELGALALLPHDLSREKWRSLMVRMVDERQRRTESTG